MRSSTSRPQRRTHLMMFCAALTAPVTMCTFASSRTPDMPIGSFTPSCSSMMNSCGRMCRIFWSAGMATARAASMTRSTSPAVTSLSRMATMPCELRLFTWLPAMPANPELISQPAISSASSTARWMDCTVDSMFTTTPFFSPREGCEPMPMISMEPSECASPTMATTLEVPMSSPTINCLSVFLDIRSGSRRPGCVRAGLPADGESVGVTHIHVGNAIGVRLQHRPGGMHEAMQPLVDVAPAKAHFDAARQPEAFRAALAAQQAANLPFVLRDRGVDFRGAAQYVRLRSRRPADVRQHAREPRRAIEKHRAGGIHQRGAEPGRGRLLLAQLHDQRARPLPAHRGVRDPGLLVQRLASTANVDPHETLLEVWREHCLHFLGMHAFEFAGDLQGGEAPVGTLVILVACRDRRAQRQHCDGQPQRPPIRTRRFVGANAIRLAPAPPLHRATSSVCARIRSTSSSNSMPTARADIGTRL